MRQWIEYAVENYRNKNSFGFQLAKDLKARQIDTAIEQYARIVKPEEVVALLDTTVVKSGKSGFLFTDKYLYSSNEKEDMPVELMSLKRVSIRPDNNSYCVLEYEDGRIREIYVSVFLDVADILNMVIGQREAKESEEKAGPAENPEESETAADSEETEGSVSYRNAYMNQISGGRVIEDTRVEMGNVADVHTREESVKTGEHTEEESAGAGVYAGAVIPGADGIEIVGLDELEDEEAETEGMEEPFWDTESLHSGAGNAQETESMHSKDGDAREAGVMYSKDGDVREAGAVHSKERNAQESRTLYSKEGNEQEAGVMHSKAGDVQEAGVMHSKAGDEREPGVMHSKEEDIQEPEPYEETLEKAQNGDKAAMYQAAEMLYAGQGIPQNSKEALKWFRESAKSEYVPAMLKLMQFYGEGELVKKNLTLSMSWAKKAAATEDPEGQHALAKAYIYGEAGVQDTDKGLKLLDDMSAQGDAEAEKMAAKIRQEIKEAKERFDAGIRNPSTASGYYEMGMYCQAGDGYYSYPKEAVQYFKKAAEKEHVHAQYQLALAYHSGEGIKKDETESIKWLEKAAAKSHKEATELLEEILGKQRAKREKTEFRNHLKQAEKGDAYAQSKVAELYLEGIGIKQNVQKGIEWYEKASESDEGYAARQLAKLYTEGKYIPADEERAAYWRMVGGVLDDF